MDDSHSCADTVARNSRKPTARIPRHSTDHSSALLRTERPYVFNMCESLRFAMRKGNPAEPQRKGVVRGFAADQHGSVIDGETMHGPHLGRRLFCVRGAG